MHACTYLSQFDDVSYRLANTVTVSRHHVVCLEIALKILCVLLGEEVSGNLDKMIFCKCD